ncbi:hypothetical protein [Micromonospora globbae]|uniref:Uncharacterized protein n=2 Tax=Micromonospora globbae TaxID=1894969 RepID=A0A420F8M3_9ACTN|nr:hypothetical protein [Micromonospora globbae]RKF29288.1 hypothetical protein D7I43_01615 [Micromonospora globbae]WTF84374.1 hypothetical protein OH732_21930 [Micromonospora globbae]
MTEDSGHTRAGWAVRRYVVTVRQPGDTARPVSRHFTSRAANRRADWLRRQSDYADCDVRVRRLGDGKG